MREDFSRCWKKSVEIQPDRFQEQGILWSQDMPLLLHDMSKEEGGGMCNFVNRQSSGTRTLGITYLPAFPSQCVLADITIKFSMDSHQPEAS